MRTLHHYDEIGLVAPTERSPAGYRLYGPEALVRLARVVAFRQLGFSLEEIARLLEDPEWSRVRVMEARLEEMDRD